MSTLSFNVLWRDGGAAKGLQALGTQAEQAHAKMLKFNTAVQSGQGAGKGLAGLSSAAGKFGIAGAALGVGIGLAVRSAARFDSAMSKVAATGQDARVNMDALRKAAIEAGASTAFSATEAAGGIEALAKAGVSAKDTLGGGLKGALDLAAAGGLGVEQAAEAAASAMNQFGLKGKDVSHIADLLAQGAGTAAGEVSDMAQALNQSGLVANQFGLSIDETTQALALFAKNGLVGADSGTSFKTMLTSLYAPSGNAAKTLDKLGLSAYDATGALKPIGVVADDLKAKLDGLSEADRNQALKNIFGSDAIRAGTILLKDGSKGLAQMATEFSKFGSASDVAKTKLNNLTGDIEAFKGSVETAMIGLGESAQGPLRGLVKGATDVVNAFNGLSDGAKSTVLGIGAGAAGILLTGAALGKLAVFATEAKVAMAALGITAKTAIIGIPAVGLALAAISAAVSHFVGAQATAAQSASDFASAMQTIEGSVTAATAALNENVRASAFKKLQDSGATEAAKALGLGMNIVTDAALGQGYAMDLARRAIADAMGTKSQKDAMDLGRALNLTSSAAAAGVQAENDRRAAMNSGTTSSAQAAQAAQESAAAADEQAAALQAVADKARDASNALVALSGSQIGMEAAIDAANKSAKDNGRTLDVNTAKGRANKSALDSLAGATLQYTDGLIKSGASADKVAAANERGRSSFVKTARAMGASKSEANGLADALFTIPDSVKSQIVVAGGKVSKKEAADLNKELKGIPAEKRAEIVTIAQTKGAKAARQAMAEVKDKTVIAKSQGDLKGTKQVKSAMSALKDRLVLAKSRGDVAGAKKLQAAINALRGKTVDGKVKPVGVGGTQKSINSIKDTNVKANVKAVGVAEAQRSINSLHGKTVTNRVKTIKINATGGPIGPMPRLAGGGRVRVGTTNTADDVLGVDRRTGMATSFVSFDEYVTNAKQYRDNKEQVETINAGGKWDLVPRLAGGGRLSNRDLLTAPMVRDRHLVSAGGRGGSTYIDRRTISLPNYVGSPDDIIRAIAKADKTGALDTISRGWVQRWR